MKQRGEVSAQSSKTGMSSNRREAYTVSSSFLRGDKASVAAKTKSDSQGSEQNIRRRIFVT